MGYKYGVWLVYNTLKMPMRHIGHFTITCQMEKEEAEKLYRELIHKFGKYHDMCVESKKPVYFDLNMYEDDDMYSWGYNGHITQQCEDIKTTSWSEIEEITKNYKCNFSHRIHTSIDYSKDRKSLHALEMLHNKVVTCSIELVDITSDNPSEWSIIRDEIEQIKN